MRILKKVFLFTFLLMTLSLTVCAEEADHTNAQIEAEGFSSPRNMQDKRRSTYSTAGGDAALTVSREDGIYGVYVEFDRIPQEWTMTDTITGKSVTCGENAFLHEYVDVASLFDGIPRILKLDFAEGTVIADICVFSDGELPEWVQIWEPPCEKADLLLLSSHSDDEQLFFAGVLPYYAAERGLSVQVVYLIQHFQVYNEQNHQRPHEQLDGLWTVGVRNYPVIPEFPDLYSQSKDRSTALSMAVSVFEKTGYSYDDFTAYITECLRRFQPLVVVSHDLDGEYGHGTHVLCAAALSDAIVSAADAEQYPESADAYGTWEVQKTYLHLYEENPIVMDFDIPLESFGGRTAFQMTQEGFRHHTSQHWTWFYKWIYGTDETPIKKAADIKTYSPCLYGLYDTKVGNDEACNDFFEHIETYEERAIAEAERAAEEARLEAERKAAEEEAARLAREEAERIAAEEAARLAEEEAALAAEAARLEQRDKVRGILTVAVILIVGTVFCVWLIHKIMKHEKN